LRVGPERALLAYRAEAAYQRNLNSAKQARKAEIVSDCRAVSHLFLAAKTESCGAHNFLHAQRKNYRYALAVCGRHGCGKEATPREDLEKLIETRLANDWLDRTAAIVIDPELENWFWTNSTHVAEQIGWAGGMEDLRVWLLKERFVADSGSKPNNPKAALEKALRLTKKPRSSALYQAIASRVSFRECVDPAFLKLKATLQGWFPRADY
jgi:hypothetical protein